MAPQLRYVLLAALLLLATLQAVNGACAASDVAGCEQTYEDSDATAAKCAKIATELTCLNKLTCATGEASTDLDARKKTVTEASTTLKCNGAGTATISVLLPLFAAAVASSFRQ